MVLVLLAVCKWEGFAWILTAELAAAEEECGSN